MSYLSMTRGAPNFAKAAISFWFRVPKESLDALWESTATLSTDAPFYGIMPLVIFGDDTMQGYHVSSGFDSLPPYHEESWKYIVDGPSAGMYRLATNNFGGGVQPLSRNTHFYRAGEPKPRDPCYIGIDSNRDSIERWDHDFDPDDPDRMGPRPKPNVLRINIQMTSEAATSGWVDYKTSEAGSDRVRYDGTETNNYPEGAPPDELRSGGPPEIYGPDTYGHYTTIVGGHGMYTESVGYSDASVVQAKAETEYFQVRTQVVVQPDHWHHVIVSFDLTGSIEAEGIQGTPDAPDHGTVTTSCKIWAALDDVNIAGIDLHTGYGDNFYAADISYVTSRLPFGDNDLVTVNAIGVALTRIPPNGTTGPVAANGFVITHTESGHSKPVYSFSPGNIESAKSPMAIPASPKYVENILHCEYAVFQMWTDVTLDTGKEANRRAFVDEDGEFVSLKKAEELLGKKPEVLLHGTGNWKRGKNSGTLGKTSDGEKNPEGQFEPTGGIDKYKPDPSLNGPQEEETGAGAGAGGLAA